MIFLTGDTHGELDRFFSRNWPEGRTLSRSDYVIILGDFGLFWDNSESERYWLGWLSDRPWTTLFLDGNHENFKLLNELPRKEMFGDDVGVAAPNVFHLLRGRIYNIDDKRFFTMGGGHSIDKAYRREGISWWPEEKISKEDLDRAYLNLFLADYEVDYGLSHVPPSYLINEGIFGHDGITKADDLESIKIRDLTVMTKFKHWYFGHMHRSFTVPEYGRDSRFTCLYRRIIKLDETVEFGGQ